MAAIFQVDGLIKSFGGVKALDGLSLSVNDGEILGIIGPNGAGKTAFVNCSTGFYSVDSGRVLLDGSDMTNLPTFKRGRSGLARTFQNIRVFRRMTTLENVIAASREWVDRPLRSVLYRGDAKRFVDPAMALLERVRLSAHANRFAGDLAYGELRRLEIARALATRPKLLFLDEPSAGMNDQETAELLSDIKSTFDLVRAIVVIEHDIGFIRELSHRVVAMENGRKLAEGTADEVLGNEAVIAAYIGTEDAPD